MTRQKEKGERQRAEVGAVAAFAAGLKGARRTAARPALLRPALLAFLLLPFTLCLSPSPARAQYGRPPESGLPQGGTPDVLKTVGIEQRLNGAVPLDLAFRDEAGRDVRLGDYFKRGKPVVLSLVYYECPMMCNEILNGLVGALSAMKFTPGDEFEVVTVSFDPRERPELAARKKETYLRRYARGGATAAAGWHFLTGDQPQIDALTRAAGFNYVWDDASKQFAHSSAIMVVTPQGRLSHYFYGIEYAPKELRLALVEASDGRIGSPVDQLILYCYHYDPARGGYAAVIMNIVRLAGVLTLVAVAALMLALRRWRPGGRRGGGRDEWDESVNVGGTA